MKLNPNLTICIECGVSIKDTTAKGYAGLCESCLNERTVRTWSESSVVISQGCSIDWQCILIKKYAETSDYAKYRFVANVLGPDPERRDRSSIIGQAEGILCIINITGEVLLDKAMLGDTDCRRFDRAAHKIKQYWNQNEYPEETMFACG